MSDPDRVANATRLYTLKLTNYRQFSELYIQFEDDLTVLVAENGGGKTPILDAASVALRYFVESLIGAPSHGFEKTDIRMVLSPDGAMVRLLPTTLHGSGLFNGRSASWTRELASAEGKTTFVGARELKRSAEGLRKALQRYASGRSMESPTLPLVAYYGTGRLWREGRLSLQRRTNAQDLAYQLSAYSDCLEPSSSFNTFVIWFEAVVREAQNEGASGVASPYRPSVLLEGVRRATDAVLAPSGWNRLDWDFLGNEVVATHPTWGRLPVALLSDGVRNTLALVADLAHRCVRLNPQFGADAAQQASGIVLIDEVDMHLHPGWQQTILRSFRQAFPNLQFVVTTHSPQVISTVPARCIRILSSEGVSASPAGTQGADAARVLRRVFRVNPRPSDDPVAQDLAAYLRLVDEGAWDSEEARVLREGLDQAFQQEEPALLEADLRFENAKWEAES